MQKIAALALILLALASSLPAQYISHNVNNKGVYEFIDELANEGLFDLNSVVKPYSRMEISEMLRAADEQRDKLTGRQQKELDFYLRDFGKEFREGKDWDRRRDLFFYDDSMFTFTVNPILGGEAFFNSSGRATHWRNGAEAWAYYGKWSFWASLRDNHEKPLLSDPDYLTQREGGHIKMGTDWSEMQGGVAYGWKSGYLALVKDGLQWGNHYNGANIFGGHTPTFFQFRMHLEPTEWFQFNYFHGILVSMEVDSTRSYWLDEPEGPFYRSVYHRKYIAANMFSFRPLKNLWISGGNSIIYTDLGFHPVYLIPVFFYKSVDHTYNSGIDNMNSHMFLDISSRQIKHLHLYGTVFIDELSIPRIFEKGVYNYFSWKAGFRLSNFPLSNLSLTTELTINYPYTFRHPRGTLTYETNNYNMGHYLKDNAREWFVALDYKPLRAANVRLFFTDAVRGPDYVTPGGPRLGFPIIGTVEWQSTSYGIDMSYQLINDLYLHASFVHSNTWGIEEWSAPYFRGVQNTINFGLTLGY
ncbi:MAG: hypothetical protein RQ743_12270 [Bacteroidales bacterium]|nr:hypothetical protein [Bacteroidales bacterium]